MAGRCDANIKVIFPKQRLSRNGVPEDIQSGDYIAVKVIFIFWSGNWVSC